MVRICEELGLDLSEVIACRPREIDEVRNVALEEQLIIINEL